MAFSDFVLLLERLREGAVTKRGVANPTDGPQLSRFVEIDLHEWELASLAAKVRPKFHDHADVVPSANNKCNDVCPSIVDLGGETRDVACKVSSGKPPPTVRIAATAGNEVPRI